MFLLIICIKFLVSSSILFANYWIFLRNRSCHQFNRIYLIGLLLFSLWVPFIQLPISLDRSPALDEFMYRSLDIRSGNIAPETWTVTDPATRSGQFWLFVLFGVYLLGTILAAYVFIRSLVKIIMIRRSAQLRIVAGIMVYEVTDPQAPFTFLHSLYWNQALDPAGKAGQQILQHELVHIREKHSWDILLLEVLLIPLWFNPILYLVKKELAVVHEFRADQVVAGTTDPFQYAETILQHTISGMRNRLMHSFFNHPIKRRILMLTKSSQPGYRQQMFAIPAIAAVFLSLVLFANQSKENVTDPDSYLRETLLVVDAGHGGVDAGASGLGDVKEKNVNLAISREIARLAPSYHVKVILTREQDALPGNGTEVRESLIKRSEIGNASKADLFISIHMAAGTEFQSGFQVILPNSEISPGMIASAQTAGSMLVARLKNWYTTREELLQPKQNIYVLNNSTVPAILLHCGNISDSKDLAFVSDPANQEKMARAILEAAAAFGKGK